MSDKNTAVLTKHDLYQISLLLDQKLDNHEVTLKRHEEVLQQHTKQLKAQAKQLRLHTKLLKSLKEDQKLILDMFDRELLTHRKRLNRLERHVGLPSFV